jgi:hypothetical protein
VYVPMIRSHETVHTFAKPSLTLLMILFDPPKRFSTKFDPFLVGLVKILIVVAYLKYLQPTLGFVEF